MSVHCRALIVLLLASPVLAAWESGASEQERANVAEQGRALYEIYCQSCHGADGDGKGAPAESPTPPPDLTRLRSGDGSFPAQGIHRAIDGRERVAGHQIRKMPIWGLNFQQLDRDTDQEDEVRRKIQRIVAYLESIQSSKDED